MRSAVCFCPHCCACLACCWPTRLYLSAATADVATDDHLLIHPPATVTIVAQEAGSCYGSPAPSEVSSGFARSPLLLLLLLQDAPVQSERAVVTRIPVLSFPREHRNSHFSFFLKLFFHFRERRLFSPLPLSSRIERAVW